MMLVARQPQPWQAVIFICGVQTFPQQGPQVSDEEIELWSSSYQQRIKGHLLSLRVK